MVKASQHSNKSSFVCSYELKERCEILSEIFIEQRKFMLPSVHLIFFFSGGVLKIRNEENVCNILLIYSALFW